MSPNAVHNRLIRLSQPGTYELFLGHLFRSTADMPIRIKWKKEDGRERYYRVFWDTSAYTGIQSSITKQEKGQYNLQTLNVDGEWRTIDFTTITNWSWMGIYYTMK